VSTRELDLDAGARELPAEIDGYKVLAEVGRGGMGSVFKVQDTQGLVWALKLLRPDAFDPSKGVARFEREVKVLARLKHPNIPRVGSYGTWEGAHYYVGEFVEGVTLTEMLEQQGGVYPPRAAAVVAAYIASALHEAHAAGVVHRDVKPQNIMITMNGVPKLLDFGVARVEGVDFDTLTKAGMIVGTPHYMSPEQFEGGEISERSDIYSLGVVLYQMLVGRLPFGGTIFNLATAHKEKIPDRLRQHRREVPVWLESVVMRCLEKDPLKRWSSASQLAQELTKQRATTGAHTRVLENGDRIIQDDTESEDYALSIVCTGERRHWELGKPLRFEEHFYRIDAVKAPEKGSDRWRYDLAYWPEHELLRGLLNYEDTAYANPEKRGLMSKVKGMLKP
jgi:serine/threonine protein kinase